MTTVPVTPAVVAWAVDESGFSLDEIADATDTPAGVVSAWLKGTELPSLGQARKLAKKLRRPLAALLWATPPVEPLPEIAFRAPIAEEMRDLGSMERRYIRQSVRLQRVASWLRREMGTSHPSVASLDLSEDASVAAIQVRDLLGVAVETQLGWDSEYVALRTWREVVERFGVLTFSFPLGSESCRGMAFADTEAPVIVINTHWNAKARIFTLFHELGHVLTKTTSACAESWAHSGRSERVERWCEAFAAALLMPWPAVEQQLLKRRISGEVDDLSIAISLARAFKVSLQAVTLRLIHGGRAKWSLWEKIPRDSNDKADGGAPPDEPRTTPVIRIGELGSGVPSLLLQGMKRDLLERSQVASYLRVSDEELSEIERRLPSVDFEENEK
jgi:Zn-dependent peptidase ImmA (M78 family)/transcriptional regulator with XRE-family HTH domain